MALRAMRTGAGAPLHSRCIANVGKGAPESKVGTPVGPAGLRGSLPALPGPAGLAAMLVDTAVVARLTPGLLNKKRLVVACAAAPGRSVSCGCPRAAWLSGCCGCGGVVCPPAAVPGRPPPRRARRAVSVGLPLFGLSPRRKSLGGRGLPALGFWGVGPDSPPALASRPLRSFCGRQRTLSGCVAVVSAPRVPPFRRLPGRCVPGVGGFPPAPLPSPPPPPGAPGKREPAAWGSAPRAALFAPLSPLRAPCGALRP